VGLPEKDVGGETERFSKNYPIRNNNFETYIRDDDEGVGKEVEQ